MNRVVVPREVASETWRKANPRHCPVVLRDGDGKSVGPCWHYLRDGACPSHGKIYEQNTEACGKPYWGPDGLLADESKGEQT